MSRVNSAGRGGSQGLMAASGSIIDHIAESVAVTSAPRDIVAANAGAILTLRKASAQSTAMPVNAAIFRLVKYFFTKISLPSNVVNWGCRTARIAATQ
jgi:hypothetical protein